MNKKFNNWLDTFVDEKGLNREAIIEVEGKSGLNIIPLQILLDAIKGAPENEQAGIKKMIVLIDFKNADVMRYFSHLAQAIAV